MKNNEKDNKKLDVISEHLNNVYTETKNQTETIKKQQTQQKQDDAAKKIKGGDDKPAVSDKEQKQSFKFLKGAVENLKDLPQTFMNLAMEDFNTPLINLAFDKTKKLSSEFTNATKELIKNKKAKKEGLYAEQKEEKKIKLAEQQNKIQEKQTGFLEGLLASFNEKKGGFLKFGLGALGALAAGLFSPVAIISGFFEGVASGFKVLNKMTGGKLSKIIKPFTWFITGLKNFFLSFKSIKGVELISKPFKTVFGWIQTAKSGLLKLVRPVINFFKSLVGAAKASESFMGPFSKILKFAKNFGKFLGKLAWPIQLIMSVADFVTGFIDGYKEDGILGGIEGGVRKLVNGVIGIPTKLIGKLINYIATMAGFDEAGNKIEATIKNFIDSFYDKFTGFIDAITPDWLIDFGKEKEKKQFNKKDLYDKNFFGKDDIDLQKVRGAYASGELTKDELKKLNKELDLSESDKKQLQRIIKIKKDETIVNQAKQAGRISAVQPKQSSKPTAINTTQVNTRNSTNMFKDMSTKKDNQPSYSAMP